MEEERQIEKVEIVEGASHLPDGGVPVPSDADGEVAESLLCIGEDAQLLSLTPWEIASRRAIGQIIDFLIAYGGLFLYYIQSGLISYRGSGDLIHPLAFILKVFSGWQLAWLFILVPVPYLYLCWYFRDFRRYYTPGELIVGIGRSPVVSDNDSCRWHWFFAFWQFGQVILALVCGFIALIPDCWLFGLVLVLGSVVICRWEDDVFEYGMYLVVLGIFFRMGYVDRFSTILVPVAYSVVLLTVAFWALCRENFPAHGNKLQSRSDLRFGMRSVALRKIGKSG